MLFFRTKELVEKNEISCKKYACLLYSVMRVVGVRTYFGSSTVNHVVYVRQCVVQNRYAYILQF